MPAIEIPEHGKDDIKQKSYLVPTAPLIKKRPTSQAQVMDGESASTHIQKNPHKFTAQPGLHEWLHLQAFSHGGEQDKSNLVAGSKDSNSLQIGIEEALIFCQSTLNSVIGNIIINVNISSTTLPGTHIGTLGTYSITLTDLSSALQIVCPTINLNMNYHASAFHRPLRIEQVRVVYIKVCEMIFEHTNQLLGMSNLIDSSSMIDISAAHLSDEHNDEAIVEGSNDQSTSDNPTSLVINDDNAGASMADAFD